MGETPLPLLARSSPETARGQPGGLPRRAHRGGSRLLPALTLSRHAPSYTVLRRTLSPPRSARASRSVPRGRRAPSRVRDGGGTSALLEVAAPATPRTGDARHRSKEACCRLSADLAAFARARAALWGRPPSRCEASDGPRHWTRGRRPSRRHAERPTTSPGHRAPPRRPSSEAAASAGCTLHYHGSWTGSKPRVEDAIRFLSPCQLLPRPLAPGGTSVPAPSGPPAPRVSSLDSQGARPQSPQQLGSRLASRAAPTAAS